MMSSDFNSSPDVAHLDGTFVEISGLPAPSEVIQGPRHLRGTNVNANGKKGIASFNENRKELVVETLDGLVFAPPPDCIHHYRWLDSLEGGIDLVWPPSSVGEMGPNEESLGMSVVTQLGERGFTVLHVSDSDKSRDTFVKESMQHEFETLGDAMKEAYLGRSSASKIAWLSDGCNVDSAWDHLLDGGAHHVASVARAMSMALELDFVPWDRGGKVLVRVPLVAEDESVCQFRGDVECNVVKHLDFIRRRRFCLMHFLENSGGFLELQPVSGGNTIRIQIARGRLVVFDHTLMRYSYQPIIGASPSDDVVLQAWMFEEPMALRLDGIEGADDAIVTAGLGGCAPPQPVEKHVHIMSAALRFPGDCNDPQQYWTTLAACTDTFIETPISRWDVAVWYSEDTDQFGQEGKTSTKHAGYIEETTMKNFDNNFFGISSTMASMIPPTVRLLLEASYECCHAAGHDFDTLKGHNMALTIADIGVEWDPWVGYLSPEIMGEEAFASHPFEHNCEAWSLATPTHGLNSASQLAYRLGTRGPVKCVDTACSASLVAASMNHAGLRHHHYDYTEALSMGHQGLFSPYTFVGLSSAGMLGRGGRSFTFNSSANGYNRGEGCGGLLQRVSSEVKQTEDRLANTVSTFINQDGRSASLTAPNGPSQQAAIREAMKLEAMSPEDTSTQECHGTGTALGDPIEVGTIRAIYKKFRDALPVTSGKTHCGHLEAAAGSLGLIKTVLSLMNMSVPGNCHLQALNEHIDMSNFNGIFPTEVTDLRVRHACAGVNGFGFGGTNCRAELWGRCLQGYNSVNSRCRHAWNPVAGKPLEWQGRQEVLGSADCVVETCPRCLGPMCWQCCEADPAPADEGGHQCRSIRDEFSRYDWCSNCYKGGYQHVENIQSELWPDLNDHAVFLVGSWNSWSGFEEMRQELDGSFIGEIRIGDAGFEQFHLVLDEDRSKSIVPVVGKAGPHSRIVGPLDAWKTQNWLVDGRADGAVVGTVYEVRLKWDEDGRSISWRRLARRARLPGRVPGIDVGYAVVGSFTDSKPASMTRCSEGQNCWEFYAEVGDRPVDVFHFIKDNDIDQMIYPLEDTSEDTSIAVCGPGPADTERGWQVSSPVRALLHLKLRLAYGSIVVEERIGSALAMAWRSDARSSSDSLQLVGSFSGWTLDGAVDLLPMDGSSSSGRLAAMLEIGPLGHEEFQIVINRNWTQTLYPSSPGVPGRGLLCGPGAADPAQHWEVVGYPGQVAEVVYDESADDHLHIVTCKVFDLDPSV